MARHGKLETSNRRLAVAVAVLLTVAVVVRLLVVRLAHPSGWVALAVAVAVLAVFVGVPAVLGLRGLLRGDGDDPRPRPGRRRPDEP